MPVAAALGSIAPAKQRKGELVGGFTSALEGIYKSCLCMDITVCRKTEAQRALCGHRCIASCTEKAIVWALIVHLPGAPPPSDLEPSQSSIKSQQLARQISKQGEDFQGQVLSLGYPAAHRVCWSPVWG